MEERKWGKENGGKKMEERIEESNERRNVRREVK